MTVIDEALAKSKPGQILSADFIARLEMAIRNVGRATVVNPLAAAAGWAIVGLSACFAALAAIGRADLIPSLVSALVKAIGGS